MLKRDFVMVRANNGVEARVEKSVANLLMCYWGDLFEMVDGGIEDKAMRLGENK